jgi:DNA polymerase-1
MLYGQSAKGLVRTAKGTYGVELSLAQAGEFSRKFFVAYSNIEQWHRRSRNKSRTGAQEIRTVTGRRRFLPHGTDSKTAWDRFTCLVNTVVQGSGADGLKCAMIQVARNLPEAAHLVNTIHDELIVETPQALAEQVKTTVHDCMVQEMAKLFPQVPIEVEVKVAANWGEK